MIVLSGCGTSDDSGSAGYGLESGSYRATDVSYPEGACEDSTTVGDYSVDVSASENSVVFGDDYLGNVHLARSTNDLEQVDTWETGSLANGCVGNWTQTLEGVITGQGEFELALERTVEFEGSSCGSLPPSCTSTGFGRFSLE